MKTLFQYCIEQYVKIEGLENLGDNYEKDFYFKMLNNNDLNVEYTNLCNNLNIKISYGFHDKPNKFLELRMYTLVPYNISEIQKGIQHEHSVTNYVVKHILDGTDNDIKELYIRWAKDWKTVILLNGGTSNEGTQLDNYFYTGTMEQHIKILEEIGIPYSCFHEPDLNNMLTGISFIVDERVFRKDIYKDNEPETLPEPTSDVFRLEALSKRNEFKYNTWVNHIGTKNVLLREFLKGFKLA